MTFDTAILGERYILESPIASGGMATVWQARDDVLARVVAVKILHARLAEDEAFIERLRREALAAAHLAHPSIVSIYDTGAERGETGEDRHYIVMEYCSGGTLAHLLKNSGALDPSQAAGISATICDALAYAHTSGIVHRDVKPANVLFTDDHSLRVADFGIAKAAFNTTDITTTGTILGTVAYQAPEQIKGEEPDSRSDLYSVGVVLHELLAGRPPFAADSQIATAMAHVRTPPPPLRSLRAGIPRPLEGVVLKSLEKDPENRFSSAAEMRAAIEAAVSAGSQTAVLQAPTERPSPPRRLVPSLSEIRGWHIALVLLVVVLTTVAVLRAGSGDSEQDEARPDDPASTTSRSPLQVVGADDFDPDGDGSEHPEDTSNAIDGRISTPWATEIYSSSLQSQGKPGVGLVLSLRDLTEVGEVRIDSPTPGFAFELKTGNELASSADDFTTVEEVSSAGRSEVIELNQPTRARYWLIWITRLPAEGIGRAAIGEVRFFASG